jgi:hypothetical protein
VCMAIDGGIGVRLPQHVLQYLERKWVEFTVAAASSLKRGCRIKDVELCENWFLPLAGSKRARPVAQLALHPEGVGATTSIRMGYYSSLRNPQGGKGENVVVLSNIGAEFLRNGVLIRKQHPDFIGQRVEGREMNAARITAGSKRNVVLSQR